MCFFGCFSFFGKKIGGFGGYVIGAVIMMLGGGGNNRCGFPESGGGYFWMRVLVFVRIARCTLPACFFGI
ncbi:hypothetical protein DFH27DRAFT_534990 [Peziza echinospora]|nr:hypothetical protein DFH27DRAFT_534990 [Peziza echinospora]